jgi:hypothetical protein
MYVYRKFPLHLLFKKKKQGTQRIVLYILSLTKCMNEILRKHGQLNAKNKNVRNSSQEFVMVSLFW